MCGPNGPNLQLVGGWTNPFEKYDRQNGCIFPKFRGEHEKKNDRVATTESSTIQRNTSTSSKKMLPGSHLDRAVQENETCPARQDTQQQPCSVPGTKSETLRWVTYKIPRSTQRSVQGISLI